MTTKIKQLKNKECFFCESVDTILHHIDTDRQNNEKNNLLPLCDRCHRKIHTIYRKLTKSGVYTRNRIRKMSPRTETGLKDITKIAAQYDAGVSILALSTYWDIPYATLYRALKGRDKEKESEDGQTP